MLSTTLLQNEIQTAKSGVGVFTLPCGYIDSKGNLIKEVEIQEMDGEVEDLLLNRQTEADKKINGLLSMCIKRIGNISDPALINEITKDLTIGDRTFLMFAIRRVTYTDTYYVSETCPFCKKLCNIGVDLGTIKIKNMENPLERLFTDKLEDGTEVIFQIPTGRKEQEAFEAGGSGNEMSNYLFMRLVSINLKPVTWKMIRKLSITKRETLRNLLLKNKDKVDDNGVDTSMTYVCDGCFKDFDKELNTDLSFFFPFLVPKL